MSLPTKEKLKQFVFQDIMGISDYERFNDSYNLLEMGLDSLAMIRLVDFIETEYQVKLLDEEVISVNMKTINAIENLINKHLIR